MLNWGVTVDGVMGGRSTGAASVVGSSVIFQGNVNTNGGGFVYMSRVSSSSSDLSQYQGISLELGSLDAATVGNAPLGFEVELQGAANYCCGLSAAFAVPATANAGQLFTTFLPKGDFKTKGASWRSNNCACSTDWASVANIDIAIYYQAGPFSLDLRALTATNAPRATSQLVMPPLPSYLPSTTCPVRHPNDVKSLPLLS